LSFFLVPSLFADLTPKGKESEWFALYEITDKGTKKEKKKKGENPNSKVSEWVAPYEITDEGTKKREKMVVFSMESVLYEIADAGGKKSKKKIQKKKQRKKNVSKRVEREREREREREK
jgi:hypothetical protein